MIGLVDCESFYVSCETAFCPELMGKPMVVVLSNNDHWIIALNREAKALGLKRGQRLWEVKKIIEDEGVTYYSSNYALYNNMSQWVMETLREFSPEVEIYSIDEAFIDLAGFNDLVDYARKIKDTIFQQTFLSTTNGVGATKSLAKVAQRLSKKREGILILDSFERIQIALKETPIEEVWGIGHALSSRLIEKKILNAYDFVSLSEWEVKKMMTTVGWRLQRELKGIRMNNLKREPDPRKQIISARQFGNPVKSLTELDEALSQYTEMAVKKLRDQNSTCRIITVILESSRIHERGGAVSAFTEIPESDYLPLILKSAKALLCKIYRKGFQYWRTTILLYGIESRSGHQIDLFLEGRNPKESIIMDTIDNINKRYGSKTIYPGGSQATANWMMRRDFLAPHYTTRLEDALQVLTFQ